MRRNQHAHRRGFSLMWALVVMTAGLAVLAPTVGLLSRMIAIHRSLRLGGETARVWQNASAQWQTDAWSATKAVEQEGVLRLSLEKSTVEYRVGEQGMTRRELVDGKPVAVEEYRVGDGRRFTFGLPAEQKQVQLRLETVGPEEAVRTVFSATATLARHATLRTNPSERVEP